MDHGQRQRHGRTLKGGFSFQRRNLFSPDRPIPTEEVSPPSGASPFLGLKQGRTDDPFQRGWTVANLGVRMDGSSVSYRTEFETDGDAKGWQVAKVPFENLSSSSCGMRLPKDRYP